MEPDGEEDTKVLASIIERGNRIIIALETASFFMSIRNFELMGNEETTVYSDIGSWSATRKMNNGDIIEGLKIDRNSGFIQFHQTHGNIGYRGVGQCEKVNSNAYKF